jgi:hypothetical protein
MVGVREENEARGRTMSWEQVSRFGIAWHKARGLDFSKLSIPGGAGA